MRRRDEAARRDRGGPGRREPAAARRQSGAGDGPAAASVGTGTQVLHVPRSARARQCGRGTRKPRMRFLEQKRTRHRCGRTRRTDRTRHRCAASRDGDMLWPSRQLTRWRHLDAATRRAWLERGRAAEREGDAAGWRGTWVAGVRTCERAQGEVGGAATGTGTGARRLAPVGTTSPVHSTCIASWVRALTVAAARAGRNKGPGPGGSCVSSWNHGQLKRCVVAAVRWATMPRPRRSLAACVRLRGAGSTEGDARARGGTARGGQADRSGRLGR